MKSLKCNIKNIDCENATPFGGCYLSQCNISDADNEKVIKTVEDELTNLLVMEETLKEYINQTKLNNEYYKSLCVMQLDYMQKYENILTQRLEILHHSS